METVDQLGDGRRRQGKDRNQGMGLPHALHGLERVGIETVEVDDQSRPAGAGYQHGERFPVGTSATNNAVALNRFAERLSESVVTNNQQEKAALEHGTPGG